MALTKLGVAHVMLPVRDMKFSKLSKNITVISMDLKI